MEKKIYEGIEKAAEYYSNNTIIRTMISAIPYIGGSLDVIISSKGSKIIQGRIKFLLEQLKSDMRSMREEMINRDFLESEEWFDLAAKTFEATSRTRDLGKIKLYSKILSNSLIPSIREKYSPEEYLSVLSELSSKEVALAKVIYEQQKNIPTDPDNILKLVREHGWSNIVADSGVDNRDLDFLLKRLEKSGLIKELTGSYIGYTGDVYIITEAFKGLMEFLNKSA